MEHDVQQRQFDIISATAAVTAACHIQARYRLLSQRACVSRQLIGRFILTQKFAAAAGTSVARSAAGGIIVGCTTTTSVDGWDAETLEATNGPLAAV
jgi:hypothetical protein